MIGAYQKFRTNAFARQPGEPMEEHGQAFADWLASAIRERGERVRRVVSTDFGWSLMLREDPFHLRVECGSRNESMTEWGAYVVADASLFERMFRRVAVRRELDRLSKVLEDIARTAPTGADGPPE
jgi:hypothetical protein